MRALCHDPAAPGGLAFADVPEPEPAADQALVAVAAVSLNFVDVAFLAERAAPGAVLGNDLAGTVVGAAADGSGPAVGTRVAGLSGGGAWAERCALRTADLAVVPDGVDPGSAAALPAAGVTALRAVRALGPVLGRRVLVTGASGGVGRYAVQLAAAAGAEVVATAGRPGRAAGLAELGAREVVGTGALEGVEPVHGVLELVGGAVLGRAFARVLPGGLLLSIGMASLERSELDLETQRIVSPGSRIEAFNVFGGPLGPDLAVLLGLVRDGRLDPQVGWRGPWAEVDAAVAALRGREVAGKAVLDLPGQPE